MRDTMRLITRAAHYAAVAHGTQTRKGTGLPYIVHPAEVAELAAGLDGATSVMVAAAWLHDVIEDTDVDAETLRSHFGDAVTSVVVELTNQFTKEAHPDKNRKERKRLEFERLATVSGEAKVLKMLDRISNLKATGLDEGFLRLYLEETAAMLPGVEDADPGVAAILQAIIDSGEVPA